MRTALLVGHAGVAHDAAGWAFSPVAAAYLGVISLGYLALVALGVRRGRPVSPRRLIAWLAGVAVIGLALMSPIDALAAERSLTMHAVQHELLLTVAPVLLLLGLEPQLVSPITRRVVLPALRRDGTARALRAWTSPALALVLWTAIVGGGSVPVMVELAWRVEAVHYAGHVALLAAGLLLWAVVLAPYPTLNRLGVPARLGCIAVANLVAGLVAGILGFSPSVAYALPYGTAETPWLGLAPLTDQRLAAAVMMATCMVATLGAAVWIVSRTPGRVVDGWVAALPATDALDMPTPADQPARSAAVQRTREALDGAGTAA